MYDVVVVGGGITGASTAYHLKRAGAGRVLLVERDAPASGGTGKSAAIVRQHYSTALLARLARASIAMFERMADELDSPGVFEQTGYLMLLPPDMVERAEANLALQRSVGVDTRWLSPGEIAELAWLDPDGVGGVVYERHGGYADPVRATEAYLKGFAALGGEVRLRTPARALLRAGDRVTGLLLEEGPVAAGAVVNAAGPWAHLLAASAGIELPLRVVREQDSLWQARADRPLPTMSISDAVDAIYLRPLGQGRFVIGQGFPKDYVEVDPYNYRQAVDEDFPGLIAGRAERRFPTLAGMRLIGAYAALYDVTPDWYPFVGPRRGLEGYVDASGGSGHGFKIAPAIGAELARWITEGAVADDFAQLSVDRLAAGRLFVGAYGGNRG